MSLLILSGFGAILLTSFGAVLHFGKPTSIGSLLYTWGGLFITTPILYCAIFPALRSWLCNTTRRFLPLNISIYFCLLIGYGYSLYTVFFEPPAKNTFFDVILVMMFVWYTSQFIHLFCQRHIRRSIDNLKSHSQYHVKQRIKNQAVEKHDLREICCGHQLIIEPGEYFPLDGIIIEGITQIDPILIHHQTGFINKSLGDSIQAGMRNIKNRVVFMATSTLTKSSYSRYLKTKMQFLHKDLVFHSDPIAQWYPLLILTIVSAITCWWLPYNTEFSFFCAISSLLIACPCTMAIVYPLTCVFGLVMCAKNGIWIKHNHALLNFSQKEYEISKPWDSFSSKPIIRISLKDDDPYAVLRADVILNDYLQQRISYAQRISKETRKTLYQNVLISVGCHVILLPFTALGLAEPTFILGGFSVNTLLILANSTRMLLTRSETKFMPRNLRLKKKNAIA